MPLPPQIVSRGTDRPVIAGRLRVEPRLEGVQHEVLSEPTVLLVEGITGGWWWWWGMCISGGQVGVSNVLSVGGAHGAAGGGHHRWVVVVVGEGEHVY